MAYLPTQGAVMSHLSQMKGSEDGRPTIFFEGRSWFVCSVGGPECFRVSTALGWMAEDAVAFHEEIHFFEHSCTRCAHYSSRTVTRCPQ